MTHRGRIYRRILEDGIATPVRGELAERRVNPQVPQALNQPTWPSPGPRQSEGSLVPVYQYFPKDRTLLVGRVPGLPVLSYDRKTLVG